MDLAYLAILAMVIEYGVLAALVAVARSRYKVPAPAIAGHPDFERYFRVQQNTLEQLVVVIPCLWIFAATLSPLWAALLGFGFVAFRAQYAYGYYRSAPGRHYGFMWGAWCTGGLLLGALFGVCRGLYLMTAH
ncbi:MAG TPA: MAPEG family protein [Gammaproteobacteria bacterium]